MLVANRVEQQQNFQRDLWKFSRKIPCDWHICPFELQKILWRWSMQCLWLRLFRQFSSLAWSHIMNVTTKSSFSFYPEPTKPCTISTELVEYLSFSVSKFSLSVWLTMYSRPSLYLRALTVRQAPVPVGICCSSTMALRWRLCSTWNPEPRHCHCIA